MILQIDQQICNSLTLQNSGSTLICAIVRRYEISKNVTEKITDSIRFKKYKNKVPFIDNDDQQQVKDEID